jgi:hypothetical protein
MYNELLPVAMREEALKPELKNPNFARKCKETIS